MSIFERQPKGLALSYFLKTIIKIYYELRQGI